MRAYFFNHVAQDDRTIVLLVFRGIDQGNGSSGSALGENLQCSFGLILAKLDAVASGEFLPFSRIVAEPPS